MAFGLKYDLRCKTRKGNLYKTLVSFEGYTGAQIDRNVPLSPFKLLKDKATIVRGTSFEFSMREVVDFEFLEFYTNSNKNVKVELYKSGDTDTLIWAGFNLPQQYQVPYIAPPASVSFTATDGLGLLKSEAFTLTGRNSQLSIICHCIDKIGLSLGYSIAINLFETTHSHDRSPLEQTFEDSEIFAGLNCYEILEKVLNKYDAEITQRRGRWAITAGADKKSSRMLYTAAGTYEGTEAGPPVLELDLPGQGADVTPVGKLHMALEAGGKEVTIKHDYGRKDSLLKNPDFKKFTSPYFAGWGNDGTFTPEQRFDANGAYAYIPGACMFQREWLVQGIAGLECPAGELMVISVRMAAMGHRHYGGIPVTEQMIIPLLVTMLADDSTVYYLSKTGWSTTPAYVEMTTASDVSGIPELHELKLTFEPPCSGWLTIYLGRFFTSYGQVHEPATAFANVNIYFLRNGELYPASTEIKVAFLNSSEPSVLSDISLLAADPPDLPNAVILYSNITWLSAAEDAPATSVWHRLGSAAGYTIIQQLGLSLASNNRVARQKLTGDIKGTNIAFDSIIKHAYNNNREFEIAEGTWDIYKETFSVTLLELLPWSDETVEFTEVADNTGTGSGSGSGGSGGGATGTVLMTGAQIVALLIDVDGDGSGLDADLLDGQHASYFAVAAHTHADLYEPIGTAVIEAGAAIAAHLATYDHDDITLGVAAHYWGNHVNFGYLTSQTSHQDVVVDGDFTSNGILRRTAAGTYAIVTDNSANWNSAYGWGNHASAGYLGASHLSSYDHTDIHAPGSDNQDLSDLAPLASPEFTGDVTTTGDVYANDFILNPV
jgi:hypothetical protein